MDSFIYETTAADGVPVAVCGFCKKEYKCDVINALKAINTIGFGAYKSGYTIDYRLGELLKRFLLPFGNKIYYIGATAGINDAECVTGGVFGTVSEGFSSAEGELYEENGFLIGTRPGYMAFASCCADKRLEEIFEQAEGRDGFIELYNALMDIGDDFIIVSDGSGAGAPGMAATKEDIIDLYETKGALEAQRDFFGLKKIGVIGGTFDPVHNGHLIAAESAREAFGLDKVIFVPTGYTTYKGNFSSRGIHRYKMTCLAAETNEYFCVSPIEIEKNSICYTVDTVEEIRKHCDVDTEIYFIAGADVLKYISGWRGFDRLCRLCEFVIVTRPGYDIEREKESERLKSLGAKVHFIETPALDISSSYIRNAIGDGRTVKYLMPEPVEEFARLHRLYNGKRSDSLDGILKKLM